MMDYNADEPGRTLAGQWYEAGSLYEQLCQVRDRRARRGKRYPLAAVLSIMVLAKLAGEDKARGMAEWAKLHAEELAKALHLKKAQMPHHTTLSRVLGHAVDGEQFEAVMGTFWRRLEGRPAQMALDGKKLRGTFEAGVSQGIYLLSVYLPDEGVVVGQTEVAPTENELSAAPRLLAELDLQGVVVTGDAIFTQRTLSAQVVAAGGDYVWPVKDNQPQLLADIQRLFAPETCLPGHSPLRTDFATARVVNKGHGRLERRLLTASSLLQAASDWPSLRQVFKLERDTVPLRSGTPSHQVTYGISSLAVEVAPPARLLSLVRAHWAIENSAHYVRDVSFGEDDCRLRTGGAPRVMATLNNLVLGLFHRTTFPSIPQARRFFAARFDLALQLVLAPP